MKLSFNLFFTKTLLLSLLFFTNISSYSQEVFQGQKAYELYNKAEIVRTSLYSNLPSFIQFKKGEEIDFDNFSTWTKSSFKLNSQMNFKLKNVETDQMGGKHYRFQQTYNNRVIEHAVWMVHTKNGKVSTMNGLIYRQLSNPNSATISESTALNKAIQHIGAETYKWEMPIEESHLKRETSSPEATYYPTAELVFVSQNTSFTDEALRLAFKFNIYAHQPLSRTEVYVDATSGNIIFEDEIIKNIDVPGTAQTAYSGSQNIIADSFGGGYRLREGSRGLGVNTYDMNEGTSYGAAVDFTDTDNIWSNANADLDEYATDAHWGAEMTYDYYWLKHGRNSIDGAGFALNSYVHYDVQYANAFWDGSRMTYGDGNGTSWNPLTALDIAGHEVSHGLTSNTASLIYNAESGALNESFSDIFGTSIENFARPTNWNWDIGEDIGSALRSMSNPGSHGDPDTYFGNNWASLTGGDNGGVHTNSGVQNFWYYLLVTGGSGTNDNGDAYTVNGLGWDDASAIAFRNLTVYLNSNSNFADARFYSIQSAIDLFGGCSPQVEACTNAWYAVGVGPAYVAAVNANFSTPITSACSAPFTFNFTNLSNNGTIFTWDFGDGNTSTNLNPSNTYTSTGSYTVQLIADGGLCGIDTTTIVNYIVIDTSLACLVNMPNSGNGDLQTGCDGTLYDSGGSTGNYGGDEDAQIVISPIGAQTVDLSFILFDVEPGQSGSCNYDYLEVYDGPTSGSPLIGTYCNNNMPPASLTSTAGSVTLVFHSDGGLQEPGYEINWSCNWPVLAPSADFISDKDTTCNGEISFTDISNNAPSQWLWDFGDGNTSTLQNPTHDYSLSGDYTVVLTATNLNGSNVMTKVAYINVDLPASPTVTDANICENSTANLGASGSGSDLNWYDAAIGGNWLNTGATYTTPILTSTASYFVEEDIPGITQSMGPADNTFGGGGFFNGDQHLIFDCVSPVKLTTVKVYANGAGNRTVELRDNVGTVIQTATINMVDGEQVITLNFNIPTGTALQLGTLAGSSPDLFRNNDSPTFPYTVGGGEVSITASSPGLDWYYFFYDWQIQSPGCTSERTEVFANVSPQADASINTVAPLCLSDAAVALTAADAGGTWSGAGVSGTTFDPAVAGTGTHTIQYTIAGACGDTDDIDISVANSYDATITSSAVLCADGSAVILLGQDAGGIWSGTGITDVNTGEFDPSVAGLGSHTVTYTISGTCGDTDTEDITVEETPDATIDLAGPFCEYESATQLTAASSGGSWSADCGSCISTGGLFDPTTAGAGAWTITYSIGGNCPASETTAIAISECLSVSEIENNSIHLYPNPSNGLFNVEINSAVSLNYTITDITGKILQAGLLENGNNEFNLGGILAKGTYLILLTDPDSKIILVDKIIIH